MTKNQAENRCVLVKCFVNTQVLTKMKWGLAERKKKKIIAVLILPQNALCAYPEVRDTAKERAGTAGEEQGRMKQLWRHNEVWGHVFEANLAWTNE